MNGSRNHANLVIEIENFCRKQLKNSLNNTLLCVLNSDENNYFIDVMADGILTIYRCNITQNLLSLLKPGMFLTIHCETPSNYFYKKVYFADG